MNGRVTWRRGGSQERHSPQAGILPELFDGRGHPVEAQGCCVMGDSHHYNIQGPSDPSGICLIGQGAPLAVVGDSCHLVDSILYLSRSTQYHSSCICMTLNGTYYLSFLLCTFNFSLFTSHTYLWLFHTYFTTYFDGTTLAYYIFTYCPLMPLILVFFHFFSLILTFFFKNK